MLRLARDRGRWPRRQATFGPAPAAGRLDRLRWKVAFRAHSRDFALSRGPAVDQPNVAGNRPLVTRRRPGHPLFYGPGVGLRSPWIELSAPPRPPVSGSSANSKRAGAWMWVVTARWYSPDLTVRNPPRPHPLEPNRWQQAPDRQGVCVERRPSGPLHAGLLSAGTHARLTPFRASAGDLGTTYQDV